MEKKYNHQDAEAQMRELWQTHQVYHPDNHPGPLYSIDTPPPTVSGALHIGHIFSYTQADVIARYKRMRGYRVFYPFGFDDNGLPTERFVEQKCGATASSYDRDTFIQMCLKATHQAEEQFVDLWKRVGLSVDWNACYSTIDYTSRQISQASFISLYRKGYIYRSHEPALYCAAYQTSVAQADLEDIEKTTYFNTISFITTDDRQRQLRIGTTRPELLPSCVALFYHPDDTRYQDLENAYAKVPLYDMHVPIIPDDQVDPDKGTGLVMCCTFGDKTDIYWYKKHTLPYRQSIGKDGRMVERTGFLSGMTVKQARNEIIERLRANGDLIKQEEITHTVSVYERSKQEIEYVMLPQWFLSILPYKQKLLELADQVTWYPAFMKARFKDWVENLQWDWCLSRQRFYGIPFPVWFDKETGDPVLPDMHDAPVDPTSDAYPANDYAQDQLEPDTDVMDTWNTSSLTPYLCWALYESPQTVIDNFAKHSIKQSFLPMGMRPQAHDIIRTWAFYTLTKVWMHNDLQAWDDIVISGHVLSPEKQKISKSKGNEPIKPHELVQIYPADAVRYWASSGSVGYDTAFSENVLQIGQKLLVKLWNACRFAHGHLQDLENPHAQRNLSAYDSVNHWILHRATQVYTTYVRYLERQEWNHAQQTIEHFFWHDVCDNYFEFIKDQLFNPEKYPEGARTQTLTCLYHVLYRTFQMFAPFIPYITDNLYQILCRPHEGPVSIHMTKFADVQWPHEAPAAVEHVDWLLAIASHVRKLKTDNELALRTELAHLTIVVPEHAREHVEAVRPYVAGVAKAAAIEIVHDQRESGMQKTDDGWHASVVISSDAV